MWIKEEIISDEHILKEMIAATKAGMVGQFLVLAFTVVLFLPYVPPLLVGGWTAAQLINLSIRQIIIDRFFHLSPKSDEKEKKKAFRHYILSLAITSILWAVMDLFVIYLPHDRQIMLSIFVISLTFGATISLGAATRIYLLFVLPMNLVLIALYLYLGGYDLTFIALFMPIVLIFSTKAAQMHLFDYQSILKKEAELEHQKHLYKYRATHDPLTDLPNRQLFFDILEKEIRKTRLLGNAFALLFIDLNDFKKVNDTYGHRTGDQLLKTFAKRLKNTLRESDFIARLAGDEFVVLVRNLSKREEAEQIVEQIRKIESRPFSLGETRLHIRLSIGYALFPEDAVSGEELIHHADSKMYREKREMKRNPETAPD